MLIRASSLTRAWVRAFLQVYDHGETSPLVVSVEDFLDTPSEEAGVRETLDQMLQNTKGTWSSSTTASTIFPTTMWRPGVERADLYDRYLRIFERLKDVRQNRRGTYFHRMISHRTAGNQLEEIIEIWKRGIKRRSAFVASIYDPEIDLLARPYLGFPCLHQVCFAPVGKDGFSVSGFYAKQDIFDRAYGNYLGLAHLGRFMATAFGRHLTRLICIASVAGLTNRLNKGELVSFADAVRE